MKCPFCTDGLGQIPVKVVMRMYPAPPKVILGERTDLSEVVSDIEMTRLDPSQLDSVRLRFDMELPAEIVNMTKTNGSTIYELAVDLSGLKEV